MELPIQMVEAVLRYQIPHVMVMALKMKHVVQMLVQKIALLVRFLVLSFYVPYLQFYVVLSCVKLDYVKHPLSQLKPNMVVGQLGVTVQLLVVEEKELEQENVSLVQILQVLVQVMVLKEKHVIQMLVKIVALVRLVCSIT